MPPLSANSADTVLTSTLPTSPTQGKVRAVTENTAAIRDESGKFLPGNPGKPKGARHMTTKIMEAIVRVSEGGTEPEDVQLVRTLLAKAKEGDMQAMKLIFNYVDGMPPQSLDLETNVSGKVEVTIKRLD